MHISGPFRKGKAGGEPR